MRWLETRSVRPGEFVKNLVTSFCVGDKKSRTLEGVRPESEDDAGPVYFFGLPRLEIVSNTLGDTCFTTAALTIWPIDAALSTGIAAMLAMLVAQPTSVG